MKIQPYVTDNDQLLELTIGYRHDSRRRRSYCILACKKASADRIFSLWRHILGCAIAIKLAMDLTITQPIQSYLKSTLPIIAVLIIMSLYVGLRTGIFESGIVYVAVRYLKLSRMSWNDAVAMGIGFGGAEAIILGALSLVETDRLHGHAHTVLFFAAGYAGPVYACADPAADLRAIVHAIPAYVHGRISGICGEAE